jgi:alpha-D-ribose 1-methylphosphonate 5-triphosphate diphosphatase
VRWPIPAALAAHDAQMAASGITTVFDALALGVGGEDESAFRDRLRMAITELGRQDEQELRAGHFLHLRLEISHPDTAQAFPEFAENPLLRLVSLTDHTPGQGQYPDIERWRAAFRNIPKTSAELDARLNQKIEFHQRYATPNRDAIAADARELGLPLASHDDRTVDDVSRAAAAGVSISEFPVTLEAAEAARKHRLSVLMGGPNLVLGGSHSGNAAASDVAKHGWLDGLTSDYVPASLLHGAFLLSQEHGFPLEEALAMVTSAPAAMVGLKDRGAIEPGLRADLVRVRCAGDVPRVVCVWRGGERVA